VLLVGCKTDLRQGHHESVTFLEVSAATPCGTDTSHVPPHLPEAQHRCPQGEAMARQVQAAAYLECSALHQDNVRDVFIEACTIALRGGHRHRRKKRHRNGCVLC